MLPQEFKQQLKNKYPYRTELHAHTSPASGCSEVSPEKLMEIYAQKGFYAVVITNHFYRANLKGETKNQQLDNYISDYERAAEAAEKHGMRAFLGTELRFAPNSNDYLLFGVDRDILSLCYDYLDKDVTSFRTQVNLPDSVFIQAHPFRNGMELCSPGLLDGIESFNMHPNHNSRCGIAARYAKEQNFAIHTAGSDFHHPDRGHEAVAAMLSDIAPHSSFDIAKILKSGNYIFELGENSILLP